jgi:hypothetical protein
MTTATQQNTQANTEQTTATQKADRGEVVWSIVFGFVMASFFLAMRI